MALGLLEIHGVHQHAPAGPLHHGERRLLDQADIDLSLAQRLQEIDAHGGELDLARIGAGLLQEIEGERVIGRAQRIDADRLALEILDRLDRGGGLGRGGDGEQR